MRYENAPVLEAVLALFLDGEDLHRECGGSRVALQLVEDRPAEHVRQEDVERDGGRLVLARQSERIRAALGDDALEALVARETEQDPRVVRIVLDDRAARHPRAASVSRSSGISSGRAAGSTIGW